jgi:hypothetical protein
MGLEHPDIMSDIILKYLKDAILDIKMQVMIDATLGATFVP